VVQAESFLLNVSTITTTHDPKIGKRRSHRAGLRTVGLIEAFKGVLALLAAYVLNRMIRHDVDFEDAAEHLLHFLHIGLHHHLAQQFLGAADKLSDTRATTILGLAALYAIVRFVEGYGLWRQRVWAEWLAIGSGCIYLPFEIAKLVRHPNQFHVVILVVNLVVVLYIAWVRWDEIKMARAER
jgi:uncharacterized membrane protein (DUF2068 family)